MSSIGSSRVGILLAFTFAILLTGCPGKKPSNDGKNVNASAIDPGNGQNGGYDWGGGELIKSSPALVKRTIEIAQENAGENSVGNSIYRQFLIWNNTNQSNQKKLDTTILFPNSNDGLIADTVKLTDSPALSAIAQKKIKLLESGDCPKRKDVPHADASVSKLTLDAEVCFSIGNLSKTSPSDLIRQVTALLLHEAVHMAGGDELAARAFQDAFNVYFAVRFGDTLGEAYLANVGPQLYEAVLDIEKVREQIRLQRPIPVIYATYGRIFGALSRVSGVQDLLALKLRLALKKESAAFNFVQSLSKIQNLIAEKIGFAPNSTQNPVLTYDELNVLNRELQILAKDMWKVWGTVEKASLCDDSGNFLYQPKSWFLEDVCKKSS